MAAFKLVAVFLLVNLYHTFGEEDQPFKGDKVVRVIPQHEQDLEILRSLEGHPVITVDFWKAPAKVGLAVDMHVSETHYKELAILLKSNNIPFTIQIFDVQSALNMELDGVSRASLSWYSQYHRLDEIVTEMRTIARDHSNMVSMSSVGRSYEGRDQYYIEVKGKAKANKPVFFMNCGMHAREWVTPATCMYIIKQMVSKYGKDSCVTGMLDKMDFIIMPVLNVDGYAYTWKGSSRRYRFWRKTRKPNPGSNCIGVDPNRNWGYGWSGPGASGNPCSDTYYGPRAFSEKVTKNVAVFLKQKRVSGYMDVHAYSQLWMIPWGSTRTPTKDHNELMRVSNAAINAIRTAGFNTRYRAGPSSVIIYQNSGGSKDYTYGTLGIKYSFALELRDTGRYGFLLPPDQIVPTATETFKGIIAMAKAMKV